MGDSAAANSHQQDRLKIAQSLEAFNSNNFQLSAKLLSELSEYEATDPKTIHNLAVARFCASEKRNFQAFQASIDALLPQTKKSAPSPATASEYGNVPAAGEDDDDAGSPLQINDPSLLHAYFNRAVVLFHLRQPKAALRILNAMLPHLNGMDDNLAQRCGLLAIHLLLNAYQVGRAGDVIEQLQHRLRNSAHELLPLEDDYDDDGLGELGDSAAAGSAAVAEDKSCLDTFRMMFRMCKLRCNVLKGRPIIISNDDSAVMSVLRAHQFYNGIDYQMAAKELSKHFTGGRTTIELNGEDHNTVIANNMGIIHFHVRHYAMAVRFFQHALTFDQTAADNVANAVGKPSNSADAGVTQPMPVQCLGATKRPEILYNLGIAMLHLQRPHEAFECLLVPLNYYHSNPRIWLRLAEACIMVHTQQTAKERDAKTLVSSVIGGGVHRKYVLQPTSIKHVSDQSQSFAIPGTNLEFASLCLRNASTLVEYHADEFFRGDAEEPQSAAAAAATQTAKGRSACHPSKPLAEQSFRSMRCAVLAASAYVQICLGEYQLALEYAKKLSQLDKLPDAYAMLAHLYCAEALIMLDRLLDARKYLEPKFIKELKEDDFVHRGAPDWPINTVDAAHAILTYNLAVTYLLSGDTEVARSVLAQCQHHPFVERQAKAAKLYLELQAGNLDVCRIMIRVDTPQFM